MTQALHAPPPDLSDAAVVPTRYRHRLDDGRIQCDVCPRFCRLHQGPRGLCFVRACRGGAVDLTTYGRSSGSCRFCQNACTGNVRDVGGGTTVCPGCGASLIVRGWFDIVDWQMTGDGRCARCGARCAGVFDGPPGTGGGRRRSVRMTGGAAQPGGHGVA